MGFIDFVFSMFGTKVLDPSKTERPPISQPAVDEFVGPPGPCEEEKETVPPKNPSCYRKWRMTYYVISEQTSSGVVPVYTDDGRVLANVSPQFFADVSLQGTGKLLDGRLINVTMNRTKVKHNEYAAVLEYHTAKLKGRPVGYSGIFTSPDGMVSEVLTFKEVTDRSEFGYGQTAGYPLKPFCTIATDIGAYKRSDPRFKGKGGLVPRGTRVFIKQLCGLKLPDGSAHDGWCTATDTGGAIFGAHFDLFVGTRKLVANVDIPHEVDIWFEGIEDRVPEGYTYGLKDIP